ncbi:SRPBCC family protein [Dinghuibacter silviterrae]|uniref:Ligand-binding SRPBCC domain-containing protein n=1 Tax=Dinghuibacter silviterrae TaxID=1539049 RepID=A0A4R8DQU7_9BACT|nr:SRPBCC family protein [Dinghuibacter silviterrae]TDW99784.1 ligand-binding SRPBCC domain-containing protein [Dinghuibacter silviterrae]
MPTIRLTTRIQAPPERCFDLSRSIDLHTISTASSGERAIAGRTTGLIGLGETVTWEARHFGVRQRLTSRITAFERPVFFVDEMVRGAFRSIHHEHRFSADGEATIMQDTFTYVSPLGWLGRAADVLFLERYMRQLLLERNAVIRGYAESGKSLDGDLFVVDSRL